MTSETIVIEAGPEVVELLEEADTVIETVTTTDVVEIGGETVVESVTQSEVIDLPSVQEVFDVGSQGPTGPQGPIGPPGGAAYEKQTSGATSALNVVWEDGGGVVHPLDYRDVNHIDLIAGITLTATASAGQINVQRSGPIDDSSWSWVPGRIWLGINGSLTQTPPADGYDVLIGYVVSPTRIYLDIQDHIYIEE